MSSLNQLHPICHGRTTTGVPGVSYSVKPRRSGEGAHRFFQARVKNARGRYTVVHYNIDTLGREEAWRRALKRRADYVRSATVAFHLARIASQEVLS